MQEGGPTCKEGTARAQWGQHEAGSGAARAFATLSSLVLGVPAPGRESAIACGRWEGQANKQEPQRRGLKRIGGLSQTAATGPGELDEPYGVQKGC